MKALKNQYIAIAITLIIVQFTSAQELKTIETILPFTDEFVTVEVEEKDGLYYFNKDIIVEEIKKPEYYDELFKANENVFSQSTAIANINRLWKEGKVPYVISSSMPTHKSNEIKEAIETLNSKTKINIVPRTYERDYILLVYNGDGGCNSYLGRIGGRQVINVAEWCKTGSIMHEFMHAMGFYHEHNRIDRDNHIQINWGNISAGWKGQYQKVNNRNAKSFGAYDFESIMHYPVINGNFSCYNSSDCTKVGNRSYLSDLDISGINTLYYFAKKKKPVTDKEKVPVYFSTELADDQIFENVIVKIGDLSSEFSVSFKDEFDQTSIELEEGKSYYYQVFVDCTEYDKINNQYVVTKRVGSGSGTLTVKKNMELSLYSNRNSTSGDYSVELK